MGAGLQHQRLAPTHGTGSGGMPIALDGHVRDADWPPVIYDRREALFALRQLNVSTTFDIKLANSYIPRIAQLLYH